MSSTGTKSLYLWVTILTHLPVFTYGKSYSQIKECFILKGESMGLQYIHVDKEEAVDSLEECMRACKQSFIYCKSFSYSDKDDATAENCLLSRKDTATLDIRSSRDFRYDVRHTYYELSIEDMCQRRGNGRPSNDRPSHGRPSHDGPLAHSPFDDITSDNKPFSNEPSGHRLSGASPFDNRPSDTKPLDHKTSGRKPSSTSIFDDRPSGNRPYDDKPSGHRPSSTSPFDQVPSGHRTSGKRPFENRPSDNSPVDDKPLRHRPFGDKPYHHKTPGNRPFDDKTFGHRPSSTNPLDYAPSDHRTSGKRPFGNRPSDNSPVDAKPPRHRPFGDRPYDHRPLGNMPFNDNPPGNRPYINRPIDNRLPGHRPSDHKLFAHKPFGDRHFDRTPQDDTTYGERPSFSRPLDNRRPRRPPVSRPSKSRPPKFRPYKDPSPGKQSGITAQGDACFWRLVMGRRLSHRYIRERTRARDIRDCEDKCLRADYNCFGFNYRITSSYRENCELSSKDTYNLDTADTYYFPRDEDYDYYERKSFESQCRGHYQGNSNWYYPDDADKRYSEESRGTGGRYDSRDSDRRHRNMRRDCFRFYRKGHRLDRRIVKYTVPARDYLDCVEACLRHQSRGFMCRAFAFSYYDSYGSGWYGRENCQLSDLRSSELSSYDLIFDSAFDVYTKDEYSRYCGDDDEGVGRHPRSVTVSGLRCHHRSYCQMHDAGRFYYCDTEDGGWDYCCRPDDFCDYSNGYSQKWCYVGTAGYDQWRPCVTDDRSRGRGRGRGRSRAYLKNEKPDVKLMLEAPNSDNRPKGLDLDHPIDVKDESDHKAN